MDDVGFLLLQTPATPTPSCADPDHFGELNEMVLHPLATVETGGVGGLNNGLEIPVAPASVCTML